MLGLPKADYLEAQVVAVAETLEAQVVRAVPELAAKGMPEEVAQTLTFRIPEAVAAAQERWGKRKQVMFQTVAQDCNGRMEFIMRAAADPDTSNPDIAAVLVGSAAVAEAVTSMFPEPLERLTRVAVAVAVDTLLSGQKFPAPAAQALSSSATPSRLNSEVTKHVTSQKHRNTSVGWGRGRSQGLKYGCSTNPFRDHSAKTGKPSDWLSAV